MRRARFRQPLGDARNIRPSVEHRAVQVVGGRADCWQFPIRQMCGKNQRRFAIVQQLVEPFDVWLCKFNAPSPRILSIIAPQPVEMRKLRTHSAEIVPASAQDRVDIRFGFLRERGHEIGAANSAFRKEGADAAHHCSAEI